MMKIYFNANNKATLEALERCGVRNVLLSHKYSYANIKKFRPKFESIFMVAGTNGNPEKYHDFLKNKKEYYDYAAQFDVFYKMDETLKHLENERKDGIDWTLPVLQENYLNHLFNTNEMLGSMLLTLHNINFYQELMNAIRNNIKNGTFQQFHNKYINKL